MGKSSGGSSSPKPDKNIGIAAREQAELGREWLKFAEEQFEVGNIRQGELDELTKRIGEQQLSTQDQANEWARADRERWETQFRPIEDRLIEDATGWDSDERQAQRAAEARGDVMTAAAGQRGQTQREMASMGLNPASGRFQGQNRASEMATGLAAAGAQNQARNQVRSEGMAFRADAANMGRGLPSQAAQGAALGLQAGNSALGGAMGAEGNFRANQGIMGQGFGGAMQGYANQANILNQQHQNQLQAWSANQQAAAQNTSGLFGAIGTGLGTWAGMASSKEFKENKRPVSGALEAIKGLPVEAWDYKEGIADGGSHIGPYAEDFQRQTGMGDGQTIPIIDAIGLALKGIQELDEKIDGRSRPQAVDGEYARMA